MQENGYYKNVLGTQIDVESRETAENIIQFQGELGQSNLKMQD